MAAWSAGRSARPTTVPGGPTGLRDVAATAGRTTRRTYSNPRSVARGWADGLSGPAQRLPHVPLQGGQLPEVPAVPGAGRGCLLPRANSAAVRPGHRGVSEGGRAAGLRAGQDADRR